MIENLQKLKVPFCTCEGCLFNELSISAKVAFCIKPDKVESCIEDIENEVQHYIFKLKESSNDSI